MLWFKPKRLAEGRLSAAFCAFLLLLLLAGCSNALHPLNFLSSSQTSLDQRAAKLPYASIMVNLDGRHALLVMAYLSHDHAYFVSANQASLVLRDGYLSELSGLPQTLLMTQLSQDGKVLASAPWQQAQTGSHFHYQVLREWRDADHVVHADRADASLLCAATTHAIKLTLTTLALQACTETLTWSNGKQTTSTLWRSPLDHRLWKASTQPWPGAPTLAWQVARSWW